MLKREISGLTWFNHQSHGDLSNKHRGILFIGDVVVGFAALG